MNCRRISSLLSAYIDLELTGVEMLAVREHLQGCSLCRREHETLQQTKVLLSSLSLKMPRPELESLLQSKSRQATHPVRRWLPMGWGSAATAVPLIPRFRTVLATATLSIAGLWLATATAESPTAANIRSLAENPPLLDQQISSVSLPALRRTAALPYQSDLKFGRMLNQTERWQDVGEMSSRMDSYPTILVGQDRTNMLLPVAWRGTGQRNSGFVYTR